MTIPDLGSDLPSVVLRTAIVYLCLVIGFRFLGKREAGQLSTLDLVLHAAADRWEPLRNALDGEPTILVDHGRILFDNLRREGISDRELAVALRQNQLMSAEEALFVFLETNGQISVIPRRDGGDERPPDTEGQAQDPGVRRSGSRSGLFRRRFRRPGRLSGGPG